MKTILAVLLSLAVCSPAFAAPSGCKTRTATAADDMGHATTTANCRAGEYLLTWGFSTSDSDANLVRADLVRGSKSGPPTGVTVRVDDGYDYRLTVSAVCCRK